MAIESKIGWTDATQNFWRGCSKVSEGCKYCYMFRELDRYSQDGSVYVRSKTTFNNPYAWKEPKKIFTCSLSDFFLEAADGDRPDAWNVIRNTPQHTWLILTKRPERIAQCLPPDWGSGWDNVWLGITAENQVRIIERMSIFQNIPAKVKFLSIEPILSFIDLLDENVAPMLLFGSINWIIIGGESGNDNGKHKYRESNIQWYNLLVTQADYLHIPIFVKQLGTHLAKQMGFKDRKGEVFEQLPKNLQRREYPR